jgi:intracellular sulfur oxidation DsrE/DsrF family protein
MRSFAPVATIALLAASATLAAAQQAPKTGPIIESAGAVFAVPSPGFATRPDQDYKVAFEVAVASADPGRLNPSFNSVARYLNMHAQAGVPRERIHAAIVVHGTAGWELLDDAAYRERHGVDNPNAELIRELTAAGVPVVLCGQTAASRGIPTDGLIDGVQVALSAMTAFLVLQEDGYRVNPW